MKKAMLVLLMILLTVGTAYAVCTFRSPTSSTTISGSKLFNISCATITNPTNCSVSGSSTLTGDSATFNLFNITTWMNATRVTTADEDATDWTYSATCYNITGQTETATAITGVTVDNTVPTAPTLTCDSVYSNNEEVSYAVTGAQTTACTIYFSSAIDYAMTHSGDTCTYTVVRNSPADKAYEMYAIASDGTNTTTSAKCEVRVEAFPDGGGIPAIEIAQTQTSKKKTTEMMVIIGASLFVLYLIFSSKKK